MLIVLSTVFVADTKITFVYNFAAPLISFKIMQKQPPEMFYKKAIFRNFVTFAGKHPYWRLFLIQNIAKFLEHLF